MSVEVLSLQNIEKTFPGRPPLFSGLYLKIPTEGITVLLGSSGSGKSTLLRILAGLEKMDSGVIEDKKNLRGRLSFVFQESNLLPWRTALENVELTASPEDSRRWLEKVGLKDFLGHYPHELSGGMKMRVGLARGFAARPQILLLDEPFSALDEIQRERLQVETREFLIEQKIPAVFVTHSLPEATFMADQIVVLSPGGKIANAIPVPFSQRRGRELLSSDEFFDFLKKQKEIIRQQMSPEVRK